MLRSFISAISASAILAWCALSAGCRETTNPVKAPAETIRGVQLRVSIEKHSPIRDALRNGLNEFEARTGAAVELIESDQCEPEADLLVFRGDRLWAYPGLVELDRSLLESKALHFVDFPSAYRSGLCQRRERPVAVPFGCDVTLLWFRPDLLADPQLAQEFAQQTGKSLRSFETWEDLTTAAEFLKKSGKVENGFAFACDGSTQAIRNYLVIASASAKGTRWSSFVVDTERGESRLAESPFAEALAIWLRLCETSPAKSGAVKRTVSDEDARTAFLSGKAGFLLTSTVPAVGVRQEVRDRPNIAIDCSALPGSKRVYSPRSTKATELESVNRCAHLGSGGWFAGLGKGRNPAAAQRLLQFLMSADEIVYLVQAAKNGLTPIRSRLLTEPARFTSYGLPAAVVSRYFASVSDALVSENWVSDLRIQESAELDAALWDGLEMARSEPKNATESLASAHQRWQKIIAPKKADFLARLRDTLGLPAQLLPEAVK